MPLMLRREKAQERRWRGEYYKGAGAGGEPAMPLISERLHCNFLAASVRTGDPSLYIRAQAPEEQ